MKFHATPEQAKQIMANAVNVSEPMGMGFLHFQPGANFTADDFRRVDSLDYVQGRMVKLSIKDNGDGTYSLPDTTPATDYQSWARRYPTYAALAASAGVDVSAAA